MSKIGVIAALMLLVACGAQETGTSGAQGETSPVSAQGDATAVEVEVEEVVIEDTPPPEVQSCLSLVTQGEFQAAVDACLAALGADPDNADVKAALQTAQAETAKTAAAAAASGAGENAAAAAASQLPDTPKGLTP